MPAPTMTTSAIMDAGAEPAVAALAAADTPRQIARPVISFSCMRSPSRGVSAPGARDVRRTISSLALRAGRRDARCADYH